jgi:hypothetical protein
MCQYTDDYEGGKSIMVNIGHENIDKIQVFKGETKNGEPCILMHLRHPLGQPGDADEVGVEKRTEDGNTVREHTFRARL